MQNNIVSQLENSLLDQWNAPSDIENKPKHRSHIGRPSQGYEKDTPSDSAPTDDFEDSSFFYAGVMNVPDRSGATSAPPAFGVQSDTLFAFRAMYAGIFSDIRCEQNYGSFYKQYKDNAKLPPPLETVTDSPLFGKGKFGQSSALAIPASPAKNPQLGKVAEEVDMNRFSFKDVMLPDLSDSDYTPDNHVPDYMRKSPYNEEMGERKDPKRLWEQYDERSQSKISERSNQDPRRGGYAGAATSQRSQPSQLGYQPHTEQQSSQQQQQHHQQQQPSQHHQQPALHPAAHPHQRQQQVAAAPSPQRMQQQPQAAAQTQAHYPPGFYAPPPSTTAPSPVRQTLPPTSPARAPPGFNYAMPVPHMVPSGIPLRTQHSAPSGLTAEPAPSHGYSPSRTQNQAQGSPERRVDRKKGSKHNRNKSAGVSPRKDLTARYTNIEQVVGQIYSLCKDQHGCRFLQKKLEDDDPQVTEIIFNETYPHFTELMIDPFGNYLCQKLLEYCSNEQRTMAIRKVVDELVTISKNMHGTRAVQKMIECLTTAEQVALVREGLQKYVVELIQDLNGNHVIQRCLNRLSPSDNQFMYDAVAGHCVEVATHRHGCCVLQRCLDHASDSQKMQLVREITANALPLVQDPYGNYVVQYVLDLPFRGMCANVAIQLSGQLLALSCQKFSSNVIEKLLKKGTHQMRDWMVREMKEETTLSRLLQDPFGNYVIQTALSESSESLRDELIEAIKPHLPALRNTPYGKRIQSKIFKP